MFTFSTPEYISVAVERELRDAFDKALALIRQGDDVAICQTTYEHKSNESVPPLNAVIVVVGVPNTQEILTPIKEWMDDQNRKRMGEHIVRESAPPAKKKVKG